MLGKLVRRSLTDGALRIVMTLITIAAVVLGVSFVSGSFILADSLRAVFDGVSSEIYEEIDGTVRGVTVDDDAFSNAQEVRFDESVLDSIGEIDGLAGARPSITGVNLAWALDADGEILQAQGPPTLAIGTIAESPVKSTLDLVEGAFPAPGEIVLDVTQTDSAGFALGDTIEVSTPVGKESFTLAGTVQFGDTGGLSPYFIVFDLDDAQRVFDAPDQLDAISLAFEGNRGSDAILADIGAKLPDNVEAVGTQTLVEETQADFGAFISIFQIGLLVFAGITVFVAIFLIYNIFSILVSQRVRQFGVLRAVGARKPQITRMVVTEAIIIGIIASIIGLFVGVGIAKLLTFMFEQAGGGFPDGPTKFEVRTIIVVMLVGIGATTIAALIPARAASKVSPLEAIRSTSTASKIPRSRLIVGSVLLAIGVIALVLGLTGAGSTSTTLTLIGVGAAFSFFAIALLAVVLVVPAARILGAPGAKLFGTTGELGRQNAARNPGRTVATAMTLLIGLTLITTVSVLGASLKQSINELLEGTITADLFIFEPAQGLPFAGSVAESIVGIEGVESAGGFKTATLQVAGESNNVTGIDSINGLGLVDLGVSEGSEADLGLTKILISESASIVTGVEVGNTLTIVNVDATQDFEVVGKYAEAEIVDADYLVDGDALLALGVDDLDDFAAVKFVDGADIEATRALVEEVTGEFPQLEVLDQTEYTAEVGGQIDQLLAIVGGLLGLCIVVALIGILATMVLSVFERTREIGLLRAVGMTKSQVLVTILLEAFIVTLFGALVGVTLGIVLGMAVVQAIPEITAISVPWVNLIIYTAIAAIAGVIAAFVPAVMGARRNVLEAVAGG